MSNDNSLELTGSLARKRLLPSVSEVVRGLSAQVQADPAVVFRAARQVVADELIRVKQGFEAASADVLVTRARAILEGASPDMTAAPPPPMMAAPERPFVSTQPLPQISSNDPFVETTGALDLRWDRDIKDPLAEPVRPASQAAPAAAAPFGLPQTPEFQVEATPPPVFEMTPLGLPESPPPPLEGPLWPAEPQIGVDTLEREAASVSLTDVLPPVETAGMGGPPPPPLSDFDSPIGKAEVPFATKKDVTQTSPGAADLPPGWLDRDPMDTAETIKTEIPEPEPEVPTPPPVFMASTVEEPKSRLPFILGLAAAALAGVLAVWWLFLREAPRPPVPEPVKTAEKQPEAPPVVAETPAPTPAEAPSISTPPAAAPTAAPASAPEAPAATPGKPAEVPPTPVPVRPTEAPKKTQPTAAPAAPPVKPVEVAPAPVSTAPVAPATAGATKAEPSAAVKQTRAGTLTTKDWAGKPPVFIVHFSSFKDRPSAEGDSARIGKKLGMTTRVVEVDLGEKGTWYRVVAGEFATAQEALAYRQQLEEQQTKGLGLVYKMVGQP
ncbi:MAG: SPOR domain-containing protein [Acidobacteria bacterium]|nr:SPOR domain-containing protein [Acidobacteriota bacterium]MCG3194172.1 hypothetical protein [Thermoanaerobaculia bacterium]